MVLSYLRKNNLLINDQCLFKFFQLIVTKNTLLLLLLFFFAWYFCFKLYSVQFSCSVVSDSVTPCTAACRASLSITNSWSLLKLCWCSQIQALPLSSPDNKSIVFFFSFLLVVGEGYSFSHVEQWRVSIF